MGYAKRFTVREFSSKFRRGGLCKSLDFFDGMPQGGPLRIGTDLVPFGRRFISRFPFVS